jgi:hypothetical protein
MAERRVLYYADSADLTEAILKRFDETFKPGGN